MKLSTAERRDLWNGKSPASMAHAAVEKVCDAPDCVAGGKPQPLENFYALRKGSPQRQSRCKRCDNRARAVRHPGVTGHRVIADPEKVESDARMPQDECEEDLVETGHTKDGELLRFEVGRFSNEVIALLREGVPLREAWDRANKPFDEPEVEPVDLFSTTESRAKYGRAEAALFDFASQDVGTASCRDAVGSRARAAADDTGVSSDAHLRSVTETRERRNGAGNYADFEKVEQAEHLRAQGKSLRAIAESVGLSKETVSQYVPRRTRSEGMRAMHQRLKAEGRPVVPLWRRTPHATAADTPADASADVGALALAPKDGTPSPQGTEGIELPRPVEQSESPGNRDGRERPALRRSGDLTTPARPGTDRRGLDSRGGDHQSPRKAKERTVTFQSWIDRREALLSQIRVGTTTRAALAAALVPSPHFKDARALYNLIYNCTRGGFVAIADDGQFTLGPKADGQSTSPKEPGKTAAKDTKKERAPMPTSEMVQRIRQTLGIKAMTVDELVAAMGATTGTRPIISSCCRFQFKHGKFKRDAEGRYSIASSGSIAALAAKHARKANGRAVNGHAPKSNGHALPAPNSGDPVAVLRAMRERLQAQLTAIDTTLKAFGAS